MGSPEPAIGVIWVAAGRGQRMRGAVADKLLAPLAGKPAVAHGFARMVTADLTGPWVLVTRDDDQAAALRDLVPPGVEVILATGGTTRTASVQAGLRALPNSIPLAAVHDAARPLTHPDDLRAVAAAARAHGAAALAKRVTDTIKQVDAQTDPTTAPTAPRHLDRRGLWAMQTPQIFPRAALLDAYAMHHPPDNAAASLSDNAAAPLSDDAAAWTAAGHKLVLVAATHPNPKLTHPEDYAWAEALLART